MHVSRLSLTDFRSYADAALSPGPGFVILSPLGLMLALQNSAWAKRRYVRFKRRHPRYGDWTDRVMRRVSAARRRARDRIGDILDDD